MVVARLSGVPIPGGAATASTAIPVDPQLKKACVTFEGQFFSLMLREMRKTVPDDPLLGDDAHHQQIFQGMMDDQIAQDMAKQGGSNDIASQMYNQLTASRAYQEQAILRDTARAQTAPGGSAAVPVPRSLPRSGPLHYGGPASATRKIEVRPLYTDRDTDNL